MLYYYFNKVLYGETYWATVEKYPALRGCALLQGLRRTQIRDRTVPRQSKAGVRRNVQVGEVPTNAMMVVSSGRKAASTKGPRTRATKKHKKKIVVIQLV